jgi:membrane protease YdiL (CAAX protease family)
MSVPAGPPPAPPSPPRTLRGSDLLVILIVSLGSARLFGGFVAAFVAPGLSAEAAARHALGLTIALLVVQSAVMIGIIHLVAVRWRGLSWADLGLRPVDPRWYGRAVAVGIVLIPAVALVNSFLPRIVGRPFENPQIYAIAPSGFSWTGLIAMLLLAGVAAPFVEELAFRGLLLPWLRERLGVRAAVVASALCFAVLHGVPLLIPALIVIGVALAVLYLKSGSLWPAILAHGMFNALMILALYGALAAGVERP